MTTNDLRLIIPETQRLINNHLQRNPDESITGLAKKVGIHPAQLLLFMKGERGLTTNTLKKMGVYLTENA